MAAFSASTERYGEDVPMRSSLSKRVRPVEAIRCPEAMKSWRKTTPITSVVCNVSLEIQLRWLFQKVSQTFQAIRVKVSVTDRLQQSVQLDEL